MEKLKILPCLPHARIDVVPVDYVADVLCGLLYSDNITKKVFRIHKFAIFCKLAFSILVHALIPLTLFDVYQIYLRALIAIRLVTFIRLSRTVRQTKGRITLWDRWRMSPL